MHTNVVSWQKLMRGTHVLINWSKTLSVFSLYCSWTWKAKLAEVCCGEREQCWDSLVCHNWVFFGSKSSSSTKNYPAVGLHGAVLMCGLLSVQLVVLATVKSNLCLYQPQPYMGPWPSQMSWCWLRENKRVFSLQVFSGVFWSIQVLTCSCHFWARGKISRVSPLSKCCRQREILERNPFILSVLERKFSSRPCIRALSSFRYANISAMYASRAHHSSLASNFASLNLFYIYFQFLPQFIYAGQNFSPGHPPDLRMEQ